MRRNLPAIIFILTVSAVFASDWPQWRGPNQNGSSNETNLPASLDPNTLLWKIPLPGKSAATPAIIANRLYLPSTEEGSDRLLALCVDASTGRVCWQTSPAVANQTFPRGNTMASCSPCADASGVYFLFAEGTLVKLDPAGTVLWKRNLVSDYGPLSIKFGFSASPRLLDGRLYIAVLRRTKAYRPGNTPDNMEAYLLCVNADNGQTLFKQDRPTDAIDESTNAYTTPLVATVNGQRQIVIYGGDYITGHDLQTGKEYWRYHYVTEKQTMDRLIPTPVVDGNILYATYPRGLKTFALDLNKLAADQPGQLWLYDEPGPDVCCPLLYKGSLYIIDEASKKLTCLEPKTGRVQWAGQLDKSDMYYASTTAGDDKLYAANRKGVITVVAADPREFRILSTYHFDENPVDSAIAIANGKLYLRTAKNLYCFAKQE